MMEQEKKDRIQEAAEKVAVSAFAKAKLLTGWRKWAAIGVGTLAAAAAAWLMSGCAAAVRQDASGVSARWVIVLPIDK